jgi:2-aminoadipate transaminase
MSKTYDQTSDENWRPKGCDVTTTPWHQNVAQRVLNRGSAELSNILAGPPPGVLAATGGFPHASTFPAEALEEIVTRLVRDDPAVALQYAPTEGIPSVREYLRDRQADLQGRRPEPAELIVTSGGMECIDLVSRTLINSGDDVAVEGPTYLGALMAFAGYQANLTAIPMDEDGMCVDIHHCGRSHPTSSSRRGRSRRRSSRVCAWAGRLDRRT